MVISGIFSNFVVDKNNETLLLICNFNLFADKENIAVNRQRVDTRGFIDMPEASIDTQTNIVSVSFDDSGMYTLYIENSLGDVLYQSVLPANGLEYHYDLSGIGEGYFRLVLEGASGEYEGFFTL